MSYKGSFLQEAEKAMLAILLQIEETAQTHKSMERQRDELAGTIKVSFSASSGCTAQASLP